MKTYSIDTIVVGSGCAGYNCADWLYTLGRRSLALITEGRMMGTSRNTGSDKQTYYKLTLTSDEPDSVRDMANDLFCRGGVNGDTALCEAAGSVRAFMKLSILGVPFPQNPYGEFAGYKTDHDPRRRATSAGPLTSKYMTEALEASVLQKGVQIFDGMQAVEILTENGEVRGLLCINKRDTSEDFGLTLFSCRHLVLATGGEAGAYANSVFPQSQTGANGLLAAAGVRFANLNHWQYGLASTEFRWNVSGSYQQVLPCYISVDENGTEREFLAEAFDKPEQALEQVFLKGYQWPFDVEKRDGSSRVDMLVQKETARGRRVYMDFRRNPSGLENGLQAAGNEAYTYLKNSGALGDTPFERLKQLNPKAIELYRAHHIDLETQRLEVAVCAQHQNGGAAVDADWQTNIRGLYVVGEAAGTFGAYRPGGSALNSGQVGSMRAAQAIARIPEQTGIPACDEAAAARLREQCAAMLAYPDGRNHKKLREQMQQLLSRCAAHLRDVEACREALSAVREGLAHFFEETSVQDERELPAVLKTRDILLAQEALLEAIVFANDALGSCGSALVLDIQGNALPAKSEHNRDILITGGGEPPHFEKPRPMPELDDWFENVWAAYNARENIRS